MELAALPSEPDSLAEATYCERNGESTVFDYCGASGLYPGLSVPFCFATSSSVG
jgi:hypothetical protein